MKTFGLVLSVFTLILGASAHAAGPHKSNYKLVMNCNLSEAFPEYKTLEFQVYEDKAVINALFGQLTAQAKVDETGELVRLNQILPLNGHDFGGSGMGYVYGIGSSDEFQITPIRGANITKTQGGYAKIKMSAKYRDFFFEADEEDGSILDLNGKQAWCKMY